MERILAAVDFSPVTDAVVEAAALLAGRFSARLWIVHVAAPDPDFVGYGPGPPNVRTSRAARLRDEHRALQESADSLRARGVDATALLVQGPTVAKILESAAEHRADWIVVGSHGRGVVGRLLLGSVSEGVLRGAGCPVLVVPAPRDV